MVESVFTPPDMMDIKAVGLITCLLCDVTLVSAGGLKSEIDSDATC